MANPAFFKNLIRRLDFHEAVVLGLVPGVSAAVQFGHCPDAGATETDVWERGLTQPLYKYPDDAGEAIEVVANSTDTNEITLVGLDLLGNPQKKKVNLSGVALTPAPVAGTWRAINDAWNSDSTDLTAAVTIQGDGSTSSNVFGLIQTDDQSLAQAIHMVPADTVAVVNNFSSALNKQGVASNSLMRLSIQLPNGVFRTQIRYGVQRDGVSNLSSDLIVGIPLPPLTKIKVSCVPSNAASDISAEFSMHHYERAWLGDDVVANIEALWS